MQVLGKKKIATLVVLVLSCLLGIICGIFFNDLVDIIIHAKVKETLPLRNGTIAFKFWQKPPVPIQFCIYVFHIVNPSEILAGTGVPVVVEKGPYVYRMSIEKTDIKWHDDNNTIEYIQPQSFTFDRESSVGPDTDTFLTVNVPYITVATILQHEFPWLQTAVDSFFIAQHEEAFMNRSVYDMWWGYSDPILEELANILHKLNISSPLLTGKFGFFMDRNNTGDGLYNVFSGIDEQFDNFVHIDRWNGVKNLSIWKSDYANEIRGTDGSMYAPFLNANSKLSLFDAYLLRSLHLQYSEAASYRGVKTLRFLVPYSEFASGEENPDNAGFCTPDCIPSGAYNMSVACNYAPIYVSLPHFIGGDSYYQSQVGGLRPSQSQHQPYYDIQAITGVSLRAARRYQINVRTQTFQYFTKFERFPVSYLPILWIDGVAEIDVDTAAMLKKMIQDPLDAIPYVRGVVFVVAAVFFFVSLGLIIYWRKNSLKLLMKYKKMEDGEDARLYGNGRKRYGTESNLRNQLNARYNESASITQNYEPESQSSANASDASLHAASENLEAAPQDDNSHEQSYFDTRTSLSPKGIR